MTTDATRLFNRNYLPDTYRHGSLSFARFGGNLLNQNTETDGTSRTSTLNTQNSRSGPKYPQYSVTCIRLQTFQTWPTNIQQNPDTMTEAGFYYTGKILIINTY